MKPKKIFLIRHGESIGNIDRKIYQEIPDHKVELTERGKVQAFLAVKPISRKLHGPTLFENWFKGDSPNIGIYTSPYLRARQTTHAIVKSFEKVNISFIKEDPRLIEQQWGNRQAYSDMSVIEKERLTYGSFFYRFLNGESGVDVWQRMDMFLGTLYRDFEKHDFPDNILIVTHGFALRVLLMRWLHYTVEEFEEMKNPKNCGITELMLAENDKYKLREPFQKHVKQNE